MINLILYLTFGCCWTLSYHDTFRECIEAGQYQVQRDNSVLEFRCCSPERCE